MTDTLGQSQVIPYLIGLAQNGYSITLISCEKREAFTKNEALISNLLKSHNIEWHPLFYTKRPPVISTLMDIYKMKQKVDALHALKQFKLVHCRSYITSLIGVEFSKRHSIPFVFDMRGFWADERIEGNIWSLTNPIFKVIYSFFKKKELAFVNQAAAIVSLTHAGKREIQRWNIMPAQKEKIHVIPCSADFELFAPATSEMRNISRKHAGFAASDFVLVYLGSIGTWYLLDEMLDFFVALKSKIPEAKFFFITGENTENLLAKAKEKGINASDIFIEFANRKQVPEKLAAADWGISFIKPSYSKTASSPTKMGELLAMGIPLIVNGKVGDVQEIIEQVNGGICLNSFSNKDYLDAVTSMNAGVSGSPSSIREKSFTIYSLQRAVRVYVGIYDSLLK